MTDYYFTFGQTHVHPVTKNPMKDYWIRITSPNENTARTCMALLFGIKWSTTYTKNTFKPEFYPKGEYLHITCESVESKNIP